MNWMPAGGLVRTSPELASLPSTRCSTCSPGIAWSNVEIKSAEPAPPAWPEDVVEAVRSHHMADQVVVSSFNPFALRPVKALAPEIETAYLTAPDLPGWMRWGIVYRATQASGIHPQYTMVDAAHMARARRHNTPGRVWAVDAEDDMRRMIDLGVDAIISNVPDRLLALL